MKPCASGGTRWGYSPHQGRQPKSQVSLRGLSSCLASQGFLDRTMSMHVSLAPQSPAKLNTFDG